MRISWQLLVTGCWIALISTWAEPPGSAARYYVQLVWGTNRAKPGHLAFGEVGAKLRSELSRFQWKSYWEVNRQLVDVVPGKTATARLSPECEVQIDLLPGGIRETRIYGKNVLVTRARQRIGCHKMAIHGGALETGGSWFIIVREDAPQ